MSHIGWDEIEVDAKAFAAERHGDQRYGELPYTTLLAAVRKVLEDFGHGEKFAVAAWLHDVVEDTDTAVGEIRRRFGEEVADLVWAVTGVGRNRRERNENAYEKIQRCRGATTLKLADRIANVEASLRSNPGLLAMYKKEWPSFKDALIDHGDLRMWRRLGQLLGCS